MFLLSLPLIFPTFTAAFGAEINDPLLGYVIPLSSFTVPCPANNTQTANSDNSGCPDLCLNGPNHPTETWIALVQRGKCEFVKKVREAQRLGAKAVVVGGENPDTSGFPDTLVNMYSPGMFLTAFKWMRHLTPCLRGLLRYQNRSDLHQVLRLYATLHPYRTL